MEIVLGKTDAWRSSTHRGHQSVASESSVFSSATDTFPLKQINSNFMGNYRVQKFSCSSAQKNILK